MIHRADLQAVLQTAANDHPDIDLRLGCQFDDVSKHATGLTVVQRRGNARQQELAVALIGADGIWSSVRGHLFPDVQPQFSGLIAWRGTLEASALPREYITPHVQLWMGPDAHLVAYPISAGRQINVVAITAGVWNQPGWSAPGDTNEIKGAFATSRWPSTARMLIGAVDKRWRKWALFTLPDLGRWNEGAMALLGDAAHAMLPFAAQGAGMAIEDAAVLAKALSDSTGENTSEIPAALTRYTLMRRARVLQVQRLARQQGRIYHLSGAAAIARDLAIRAMGPRRMLARQDWVYDWCL